MCHCGKRGVHYCRSCGAMTCDRCGCDCDYNVMPARDCPHCNMRIPRQFECCPNVDLEKWWGN